MILHKFKRPSWYIGGIVFVWGSIMTLTGIVQNYAGLLAVRFLLGIFESVSSFTGTRATHHSLTLR